MIHFSTQLNFLENYKLSMEENERLLDKDKDQIEENLKYLEIRKDKLLKGK